MNDFPFAINTISRPKKLYRLIAGLGLILISLVPESLSALREEARVREALKTVPVNPPGKILCEKFDASEYTFIDHTDNLPS